MPSIIELLDGIDLTQLTQKLESAKLTVSADGTVAFTGLDPRDLLGELGEILKSPDAFAISPEDVTAAVRQGLGKLDALVQLPSIPALGEVSAGLERLVGLLQDAVSKFGVGTGDIDLDALLPEVSVLDALFGDVINKAIDAIEPQIPDDVAGIVNALKTLAGSGPANGRELAQTLSPFLIGLKLGDLQGAGERIGDFLADIAAAGGDFTPIEDELRRLTAAIRSVVPSLLAPSVDVPQVEVRVAQIRGDLGLLIYNTLPGAAARLAVDLDALDAGRLAADLRARIAPLAASTRALPFSLDADLLAPLRALGTYIESLTAEQLNQHFDAVEGELAAMVRGSGIDLLPRAVDELFDVVIATMREIPIRRMRNRLIDELNAIEARIRGFEGFQAPQAIAARARELEAKLDAVDTAAVQQKVAEFAGRIQEAINQFPVNDIKEGIEDVSQSVADAIGQFSGALNSLSEELDGLAGQIEAVDFSAAGEASVALIAGIREQVEAVVGSDDVPDAARAAIGVAAVALKKVEFSVEISEPFSAALDTIDVSVVTAPLEQVTARVRDALEKVTPAAIIAELEQPFERLLEELQRLRPEALLAGLSQEFQRLVAALENLRPERLVAPLDAEFKKLTGALRKAIDPAPLFAPLKALYKTLMDLVELLDLEKILGLILGKTAHFPELLGSRLQQTLQSRLTGSAAPIAEAAGELLQWGDFLRPLASIVMQVRSKVQRLAEGVLQDAFEALQVPVRLVAGLADTAGGLATRAANGIEQRSRRLNLFAAGGSAQDLLMALNELEGAIASASIEGQAGIAINGHMAAIRVDLGAHASMNTGTQAASHIASVGAALNAPDLANALRVAGERVRALVPDALLADTPATPIAARIASLFDVIDFTALADELDAIGSRIRARLEAFARQIAAALIKIWNHFYEAILPVTPVGILGRIQQGMQRVRAEFTVLDPAALEQEVRDLVDALVDGLDLFSPASLAGQLNGVFDAVKQKVQQLNPVTLLGDLSPIDAVIDQFEALRPSIVLAPLIESTADLAASLEAVLAIDLGASLRAAVERLRAQVEAVVAEVEAEFQALLSFLESQAGGGISVSGGVSV
jgi:hypothetical protein